MKKRIGGFFEIEVVESDLCTEGDSVLKNWALGDAHGLFTTARSVILGLKEELGSVNIWIPEIYCDVFEGINQVKSYLLSKNSFDPDIQFLSENLKQNDMVIVVDYFGTEVGEVFKEYAQQKTSINWVQDSSHNLRPSRDWADFTLFSPRKLVGVADGGILVQNTTRKKVIDFSNWNVDSTHTQQAIAPFLRLITPDYSKLYDLYRAEESKLDYKLRTMPEYTKWQLNRISISDKILKRRENFKTLREEFGELLPSELIFKAETVPFGFPIYVQNRDEIQRKLSEKFIFAAIHWNNHANSRSHRQAGHEKMTLTIPCDHRYSTEDMEYIKSNLKRFLTN